MWENSNYYFRLYNDVEENKQPVKEEMEEVIAEKECIIMNDTNTRMTFNEWVRMKRKGYGLSVQKLADRSGVSKPYINKIESGEHTNCSISVIKAILGVFGYDLKTACDEIEF